MVLFAAGCGDGIQTPNELADPQLATSAAQAAADANPGAFANTVMPANVTASVLPLASLAGVRIAYDMSHNTGRQLLTSPTGTNSNSTTFADYASRGASMTVITTFTLATLNQYDVLWLEEDFNGVLTATEQAALASFVAGGGGVIVCCEDWGVFTANPATPHQVFGFGYAPGGLSGTTPNITPHPTTDGVTSITFSGAVQSLAIPLGALSLVQDVGGTLHAVSMLDVGAGHTAFMADAERRTCSPIPSSARG